MCGICGVVNIEHEDPVKSETIKKMCDSITHRGPDDLGMFVESNVGIGMRRLSIIDYSCDSGNCRNRNESELRMATTNSRKLPPLSR